MNSKTVVIVLILFLCSPLVLGFDNKAKLADQPKITLMINSSKSNYALGEVVSLDVEITNSGDVDVILNGGNVMCGDVTFLVSGKDRVFKRYTRPGPVSHCKPNAIKPGGIGESKATLLWNLSPVGRATDLRGVWENYMMSYLAFPESGVYFIKAVLIIPAIGQERAEVESAPIRIVMNKPTAEDKRVWNQIKENPELAHFIQQNEPRSPKQEEQEKLVKEVEQIVASNPNSFLAGKMRESLEKYRESEAKSKEFMENLKRRQKPSN